MKKFLLTFLVILGFGQLAKSQERTLFGTNTLYESLYISPSLNHFSDSNTFIAFSIFPNFGLDIEYRGFAGRPLGAAIFKDEIMDLGPLYNNLGKSNNLLLNFGISPFMLKFRLNKKYKIEFSLFSRAKVKNNINLSNDLMAYLIGGNGDLVGKQLNGFFNTNSKAYAYGETGIGLRMNITKKLGLGITGSYLKALYYREALIKKSNMYFATKSEGAYYDMSANGVIYQAGLDIDSNGNILNLAGAVNPANNFGIGGSFGLDYTISNKLKLYLSARDLGFINFNSGKKYVTIDKSLRIDGIPTDSAEREKVIKDITKLATDTITQFSMFRAIDPLFTLGANYAPLKWVNLKGNIEYNYIQNETQFTGALDLRLRSLHLINILGYSTNGYAQLGTSLLLRTQHTDYYFGVDQYGVATNKVFSPGLNINMGLAFRIGKKTDNEKRIKKEDKLKRKTKDRDLDGTKDEFDKCPDTKGPATNFGCPDYDKDKDGLLDSMDQCPDEFGPIQNNGCPNRDRDGDGIFDQFDQCPDAAGDSISNGCPNYDKDNDGVADSVDKCPSVFGPIGNFGCPYPDADGDGVFDELDKCPDVPGISTNDGCPEPKKVELKAEEKELLKVAFESLKFKSGKAVIEPSSYPSLNNIVIVFVKNPKYKLIVEGHTDNSGDPVKNLKLSQDRAEAVKTYLVGRGLNASQITSLGYGSSKPIDESDTPEARAKNRRVEFTVVE